jgi:hypothetical protein
MAPGWITLKSGKSISVFRSFPFFAVHFACVAAFFLTFHWSYPIVCLALYYGRMFFDVWVAARAASGSQTSGSTSSIRWNCSDLAGNMNDPRHREYCHPFSTVTSLGNGLSEELRRRSSSMACLSPR